MNAPPVRRRGWLLVLLGAIGLALVGAAGFVLEVLG